LGLAPLRVTLLAPSERYYEKKPRAHKKLTDWARQGILQLRRQLQARDPALGAGFQRPHARSRQRQPHHPIQKRRRLVVGETQIGGADFGQLISDAQTGERQAEGVNAGEDDEMQRRRQMVEDESEGLVDGLGRDDVIVVEHQRERLFNLAQFIDQAGQDGLGRRRLRGKQQGKCGFAEARLERLQRSDEVSQKACGIIVVVVE
jgi:hypothetical protein